MSNRKEHICNFDILRFEEEEEEEEGRGGVYLQETLELGSSIEFDWMGRESLRETNGFANPLEDRLGSSWMHLG